MEKILRTLTLNSHDRKRRSRLILPRTDRQVEGGGGVIITVYSVYSLVVSGPAPKTTGTMKKNLELKWRNNLALSS